MEIDQFVERQNITELNPNKRMTLEQLLAEEKFKQATAQNWSKTARFRRP